MIYWMPVIKNKVYIQIPLSIIAEPMADGGIFYVESRYYERVSV
jgi:hypothetical protein